MELMIGNKYNIKIVALKKFGAIAKLDDGSTELIHISHIADQYIDRIDNYVTIGRCYTAEAVVGNVRPVELSLKHLNLKSSHIHTAEFDRDRRHDFKRNTSSDRRSDQHKRRKHQAPQYDIDKMIEDADRDFDSKFGASYRTNRSRRYK